MLHDAAGDGVKEPSLDASPTNDTFMIGPKFLENFPLCQSSLEGWNFRLVDRERSEQRKMKERRRKKNCWNEFMQIFPVYRRMETTSSQQRCAVVHKVNDGRLTKPPKWNLINRCSISQWSSNTHSALASHALPDDVDEYGEENYFHAML